MVFAWGNNPRRAILKDRPCVVLARGAMGSVLSRFADTGEKLVTSRRAVRAVARPGRPPRPDVFVTGTSASRDREPHPAGEEHPALPG